MTREEVEKWYEDISAYMGEVHIEALCNHCDKKGTVLLSTTKNAERYFYLGPVMKNGDIDWKTIVNDNAYYSYNEIRREVYGHLLIITKAFCSKECFIDYMYEHQPELVELITQ